MDRVENKSRSDCFLFGRRICNGRCGVSLLFGTPIGGDRGGRRTFWSRFVPLPRGFPTSSFDALTVDIAFTPCPKADPKQL